MCRFITAVPLIFKHHHPNALHMITSTQDIKRIKNLNRAGSAYGYLYKYKSLKTTEFFNHVIEIIKDCLIYCPKPSELNDKSECKPQFIFGKIGNASYHLQMEDFARRRLLRSGTVPSEADVQNEIRLLNKLHLNDHIENEIKSYWEVIENRYRILSLADSCKNHHLWKNYADNYEGVCLQFSLTNSIFSDACKVEYRNAIPAIDISDYDVADVFYATTLMKSPMWAEEIEYRLILCDSNTAGDSQLFKQKLSFPRHLLTSIIFGNRVASKHKEELIKLILEISPQTQIFVATAESLFKTVTILPINIS
jgi:hypothetical protein